MRAVIQRVSQATVRVNERTVGVIGRGLLVFLGISRTDSVEDAAYLLDRGDLLWRDRGGLTRLQSPLVSKEELESHLRVH